MKAMMKGFEKGEGEMEEVGIASSVFLLLFSYH